MSKREQLIWTKSWKLTLIKINWIWKRWTEWLFNCDCWKSIITDIHRFSKWRVKSCWCLRHSLSRIPIEQLIWKRNNMFVIIWEWWLSVWKVQKKREVKVRCDCWKEYQMEYQNFKWQISCWCHMKYTRKVPDTTKHWMYRDRIYASRHNMKRRCKMWSQWLVSCYTWINICDKRVEFEWFKEDMYDSYIKHVEEYWEKQTTLDRIDSKKDYYKENCRRATRKEQQNNTRHRNQYTKWT